VAVGGLLLGALLGSCQVPLVPVQLPLTVEISSELRTEDLEATIAAVDAWNAAVPGIVEKTKVVERASRAWGTAYVSYDDEFVGDAGARSVEYNCYGALALHRDYDGGERGVVDKYIEHELGHLFGLEHSPDKASVMYGDGYEGAVSITADDAENGAAMLEAHRNLHDRCKDAPRIRQ
jgi:hypothetical protein